MKKFTGILLAVLLIFTAVSCSFFMEEKNNNSESLVSFSLSGKSSKEEGSYFISEYITYGESTVQYGTWTDMAWDIWYYTTNTEAVLFTTPSEIAPQVKASNSDWKEYKGPFRVTKGVTVWAYCENTLTSATNHNVVDDMFKGIAHEKISKTKTYITVVPELDEKVAFKENTTGTVLIDAIKYEMSREQFDVLSSGTDLKKLQVKVTVGNKEVVTVTDITFTTDTNNEYTTATAIFTNVEVAGAKVSAGGTTPSNIKLEFLGLKENETTATDCSVYNIFELSNEGQKGIADIYVLNGLTTELKGITVENKTIKLGIVYINVTETDMFPERYNTKPSNAFRFEANTANSTVQLNKIGTPSDISLDYAINNGAFEPYTIGNEIVLSKAGDKVYFRASTSNEKFSTDDSNYYNFKTTGSLNCAGNINYLLSKNGIVDQIPNRCFDNLFFGYYINGNDGLKDVSKLELPAMSLGEYCYSGMFRYCKALNKAPEILPATKLTTGCYNMMFYGCYALTTAPVLPATTMADYCYNAMFCYCRKLTKAPDLPATTLASSCYSCMFADCDILTDVPVLPATTMKGYCYNEMFKNCKALTEAPELPATALASGCYCSMFINCTALTEAPELPAETLASGCYNGMFNGCSSLTTISEITAKNSLSENYAKSMFTGVTNIINNRASYGLESENFNSLFN